MSFKATLFIGLFFIVVFLYLFLALDLFDWPYKKNANGRLSRNMLAMHDDSESDYSPKILLIAVLSALLIGAGYYFFA